MAVGTYALTSLANLKQFLNITGSGNDAFLENLVDRTTDLFENLTNRNLKARDYSYDSGAAAYDPDNAVFDGNGMDTLILPQYPVNNVTTLRINETEIDERPSIYGCGWVLDRKNGILHLVCYVFTGGRQNIDLAYNAGYSTVPEDLEQAVIEHAAWLWRQSTPGGAMLGVSSKSLADGTITYMGKEMLPQVSMVIHKYRKRK